MDESLYEMEGGELLRLIKESHDRLNVKRENQAWAAWYWQCFVMLTHSEIRNEFFLWHYLLQHEYYLSEVEHGNSA